MTALPPGWRCKPAKPYGYFGVHTSGRETVVRPTPEDVADAIGEILEFRGLSPGRGSGRSCEERGVQPCQAGAGAARLPRRRRPRNTPRRPAVELLEHPALTTPGADCRERMRGERVDG